MVLFDKDLAMYFPFSEGSGLTVFDRSKYQNNGDIYEAIFVRPYNDMSNDSDDEGDSPLVIIDDGGVAFWTLVAGVEADETTIVKKGVNSYKVTLTVQTLDMYHDYGANQDWTRYDYLTVWIYGCNTADTIRIEAWNEVYAGKTNGYFYAITDDFTGWERFFIPLARFTDIVVPTGWDNIRCIRLLGGANQSCIYYFDRMTVDVGNWRLGEALDFDGVNDKVEVPDAPSLRIYEDLTIVAWIQLSNYTTYHPILAKQESPAANNAYEFRVDQGTGRLAFSHCNATTGETFTSDSNVGLDEFVHVVVTREGNTIKFYRNGIEIGEGTTTFTPTGLGTLYIGTRQDGFAYFDGLIDEIRIYNHVLTPAEIRALYKEKEVD